MDKLQELLNKHFETNIWLKRENYRMMKDKCAVIKPKNVKKGLF